MTHPALQGKKPDPLKVILARRGIKVTQLARAVGHPRNSVSIAIHSPGRLPGVRRKIEKILAA